MKTTKLSLFVLLALGVSTSALAETAPAAPAVVGEISNLAELRWLSENQSAWTENWILTSDIDASETKEWNVGDHDGIPHTPEQAMGFYPIGGTMFSGGFSGVFDGQEHTISNLYINRINITLN